jgi:hypothetical protein
MARGGVATGIFLPRFRRDTILNQLTNVCRSRICPRSETMALNLEEQILEMGFRIGILSYRYSVSVVP